MSILKDNTISLEAYQISNEDLKGYFLANSAFFAGGFENKIKRTRQEIENLTKMIMELNSEGGKEALKSGEITKSDYTKNVTNMSKKDFLVAALKGQFLGYATLGVRGWKRGEELKRLQKELQEKLKEFDDAVVKAISTEDYEDTVSNPETDDRLDNVEEVEAMTKVKEDEIEELLYQIEDVEEVETKLEAIQKIAQEALDTGKADAKFGEVAHIALTELFGRAGIKDNAMLPSLESFSLESTANHAVSISMEAIAVALEDINDARGKARNVIVQKVDALITGAFNTLGRLERRTKDIEADIKNGDLVFTKTGKLKGGFVKKLSIDGKVSKDIVGELKRIANATRTAYDFTKGGLEKVNAELSKNKADILDGIVPNIKIEFPEVSDMKDASLAEINKTAMFGNATQRVMERLKFKTSGPLLDNRALITGTPRSMDDLNDIKNVEKIAFWKPWYLGVNLVKMGGLVAKDVDTVSKEEALAIITQIKSDFSRVSQLRGTWDKIKYIFIKPETEFIYKTLKTEVKASSLDTNRLENRKIRFINSVYLSDVHSLGELIGYFVSSTQAALDLVEKSGQGKAE